MNPRDRLGRARAACIVEKISIPDVFLAHNVAFGGLT